MMASDIVAVKPHDVLGLHAGVTGKNRVAEDPALMDSCVVVDAGDCPPSETTLTSQLLP